MIWLFETIGEAQTIGLIGLAVGLLFGVSAQRSGFCLRAAVAELGSGIFGRSMGIWLLVFFTALAGVQVSVLSGILDLGAARSFSQPGSVSGALIGGTLFGVGMMLARGCASRLLVLSATGNLRALVTGLVVTLVAQASLTGVLAPARLWLWQLWTVAPGPERHLGSVLGLSTAATAAIAVVALAAVAVWLFRSRVLPFGKAVFASLTGVAVALGWFLTYLASIRSFEPVEVGSITFIGPSSDTLMVLIDNPSFPVSFGTGLVPGVFLGSLIASIVAREFRIQRFQTDAPMERYLIGGSLMGFGAMLAGGCAVGAGVSGGSALSSTAWLALFMMWVSALVTDGIMKAASEKVILKQ